MHALATALRLPLSFLHPLLRLWRWPRTADLGPPMALWRLVVRLALQGYAPWTPPLLGRGGLQDQHTLFHRPDGQLSIFQCVAE
jgi:hypothetical protein